MARVRLQHLAKSYGSAADAPVVHDLNLEIADGEFMVLVGPSGCGKSTTLRMIAGLEDATAGTIWLDDADITRLPPRDRDIAMVFQNYALYPHMTVEENMAFGLKMRGLPRPEIASRVSEAAASLGLTDYLGRLPRELSGGQRQRVALGRAIVRQPQVFLFDEPLSNLDARMRVATRTELARLHRRLGATMIYVTHDQVEAMTLGTRICVMNQGRIMQVDTPLALYHRPAHLFVASFIGSPPMNLWPGRLGAGYFEGPGSLRFPVEGAWSEGAVTAGVRPEALRIDPQPSSGQPGFSARVERLEQMGAETIVYLDAGGAAVTARCDPALAPGDGATVWASFPTASIHFFDTGSGGRLQER